ncbi:MAG: ATP-binding protein [Kiritimatiellae bacterium]|nr:ATP-binding protein [Kiritimatiellia bacterium]
MIERKKTLKTLWKFADKRLVKVVTGIRRCGKSTLLEAFRKELLRKRPRANVVTLDFECAEDRDVTTAKALYERVVASLDARRKNYVFLDEIQHVERFEEAVDALYARKDADIYVTGSNSRLLSGEIATLLSGRHVEIRMQPLSFAEFLSARPDGTSPRDAWNDYVLFGGFPYVQEFIPDREAVDIYLEGLFNTIVVKDVVQRRKIADPASLERIVRFLFDNIGNVTTVKAVCDALAAGGRRIAPQTVDGYIDGLAEAFVVLRADRFDLRGRDLLKTGAKYYVSDMGLRRHVLGGALRDYGRVLENLVYLELLRRGRPVRIGVLGPCEIDFVTGTGADREYWQVAASVRDPATLERELRPLRELRDNYPKWLVTLDDDPPMDHGGIRQLSVLDFFLG